MPSTLTHYLFNREIIKNDKYKDLFLLAGQGADVFFFYGYNIKKRENKKLISQFGFKMHSVDPNDIFFYMLKYAFNKEKEEKEMLIEFARGFMYHYALDRNVHPYVFYNTGFPYTNKKYNLNHGRFESALDTLLMTKNNCKISSRKAIKANSKEVKSCSKMIQYVAKEVFNIDYIKEDSYYKAWRDYRFVRLFLDSRFGIKKWFFNHFLSCKNY